MITDDGRGQQLQTAAVASVASPSASTTTVGELDTSQEDQLSPQFSGDADPYYLSDESTHSMDDVDLQGEWQMMCAGPGYARSTPTGGFHPPQAKRGCGGGLRCAFSLPQLRPPDGLLTPATLATLALGQLLALLLTGTGIMSELLADAGFRAPMLQSFLAYAAIAVLWSAAAWVRGELASLLANRRLLALFALLGTIDAEATFAAVSAYRYTSLFSVQLLDSMTVPMVMALSYLALRMRYTCGHVAGAVICMCGIFALIFHDAAMEGWEATAGQHSLIGDLWMLAATALYALSNVAQEALLKGHTVTQAQWLAGLAVPAAAVSGLQHLLLERGVDSDSTTAADGRQQKVGLCLAGFASCQLAFYSLTPMLLQRSSAAFLNLSLLASDCYAALAAVTLFALPFTPLYLAALLLALTGTAAFQLLPAARRDHTDAEGDPLPRDAPPLASDKSPTGGLAAQLCDAVASGWATLSPASGATTMSATISDASPRRLEACFSAVDRGAGDTASDARALELRSLTSSGALGVVASST